MVLRNIIQRDDFRRSLTDLKYHRREILDHVHAAGGSVVLTLNGRADSLLTLARQFLPGGSALSRVCGESSGFTWPAS
jgi:hypothetical protein